MQPKNIAIIAISYGSGGAERSSALLSQLLHKQGYNLFNVILKNSIDYPYAGHLLNLGEHKQGSFKFFKTLKSLLTLKKYLKNQGIDYIIDNRTRPNPIKEIIYRYFIYKSIPVIYMVRSAALQMYFPKNKWLTLQLIKSSYQVVTVAHAIVHKMKLHFSTNNISCIYSPIINNLATNQTTIKDSYIIYVGRLDNAVKNFTLLLEAYQLSNLTKNKIALYIFGKGPDTAFIEQEIERLSLKNWVHLKPFTPHILAYMKYAKFLTLTSKFEGLPRVLIEALSVGTPVVSVDCETGPREVINHLQNGLLVENNNPKLLAEAFNLLVEDNSLYLKIKQNTISSISAFKEEVVATQWQKLLK